MALRCLMCLPCEYFPLVPLVLLPSPLSVRVEMQSKQLVPGIYVSHFHFHLKHNMPTRLVHILCQPHTQLRKSPFDESPEKPFLVDFSMCKQIIVTYHDLINDC